MSRSCTIPGRHGRVSSPLREMGMQTSCRGGQAFNRPSHASCSGTVPQHGVQRHGPKVPLSSASWSLPIRRFRWWVKTGHPIERRQTALKSPAEKPTARYYREHYATSLSVSGYHPRRARKIETISGPLHEAVDCFRSLPRPARSERSSVVSQRTSFSPHILADGHGRGDVPDMESVS